MTAVMTPTTTPAPNPLAGLALASAARTACDALAAATGGALRRVDAPSPSRLYVDIDRAATRAAVAALYDGLRARYVITVGVDRRAQGEGFEVLHCFALDDARLRIGLRVPLPAGDAHLPSIAPLVAGAAWAEQECRELLGIESDGHPGSGRLILTPEFPADVFPLRADVPYDYRPPENGAGASAAPAAPEEALPPGVSVMPLGPFFPVLEEPSQWRVLVDGESVVGCDYRGFFNHRAIEKLGDSVLGYNEVVTLAERICGICGCVHSTAYCQAIEEAAGIEVPHRARVIRTLILELERAQSHLLWLGLACHIVGFDYGFMHSWRVREPLMGVAEALTGSRKHFACNVVGGTTFDVTRERHARVLDAAARAEREAATLVHALAGDAVLVSRLKGVGRLRAEDVRAMGVVGPTARGSGVDIDARRDHPYAAYADVEFAVVTDPGCDVWARTLVRVGEFFESLKILRQCVRLLGEMPEGDILAAMPQTVPAGREGMHAVEAPRGEVFHYVLTGDRPGPRRWRVRAPSYQNLQAVPRMMPPGTTIADVPIALASIDPCFSCTERMEVIDRRAGTTRILDDAEMLARARADMAMRRRAAAAREEGGR